MYKEFIDYNIKSYYKIKDCLESVYDISDAERLGIVLNNVGNMIKNLDKTNSFKLLKLRSKIFKFNLFKWLNNYYNYNRCKELSYSILTELNNIYEETVGKYNAALLDAQRVAEEEEQRQIYYHRTEIGFKPPKKKRRKKKND